MKTKSSKALALARENKLKRFPDRNDERCRGGVLRPGVVPKFLVDLPATVFTIGSCFARNIEEALQDYAVDLPTQRFAVPKAEWQARPNGLLNEYNPGTMSQRICGALSSEKVSEETIVEVRGGFIDLLLPGGPAVSYDRALERRNEIDSVYKSLGQADLVVITLGLVESWYDNQLEVFLNRMPDPVVLKKFPQRYSFFRLDVFNSLPLLEKAIRALLGNGITRILLTVSPVPLQTTFTRCDVIVANSFSKSVLRVCAERLYNKYPQVDYFPSFEIVNSAGLSAYGEDNVHVEDAVVKMATEYMIESYFRIP